MNNVTSQAVHCSQLANLDAIAKAQSGLLESNARVAAMMAAPRWPVQVVGVLLVVAGFVLGWATR